MLITLRRIRAAPTLRVLNSRVRRARLFGRLKALARSALFPPQNTRAPAFDDRTSELLASACRAVEA